MDEERQKWENAAVLHLMSIYIATHINKQHLPSSKPQFNYKHCYVQLFNTRWYTTHQLTDTGRHGIKGFFWTYRIRDQSTLVVLWLHTYKWWCSDCNSAFYQKKITAILPCTWKFATSNTAGTLWWWVAHTKQLKLQQLCIQEYFKCENNYRVAQTIPATGH